MHSLRHLTLTLVLPAALTWLGGTPSAQTPLTTELVASGLSSTVLVLSPPGDPRLFVVQQNGVIRIIEDGNLLATPFLNIAAKVTFGGEQGLLSMAFDPSYAENGQFFLYYSGLAGPVGNTVVERYTVSAADPNVADPASACTVINGIFQPFPNHNGGHLAFGPDGYLYLSTGDGGSANDPNCRAQNVTDSLGKMLRIAVDPEVCGFTTPVDNPFTGMGGSSNRVYHRGLRNPFRWSFDRLTGEMYIGDVGQDAQEEVSWAPAGAAGLNFGWRVMEGTNCKGLGSCPAGTPGCNDPSFEVPIHTYTHPGIGVCSVTGGYVYRGCAIPDLQGTYFFADVCSNQIWSFRWNGATQSKTEFTDRTAELDPAVGSISTVVSFGEDAFGELYIVELGGEIWKIVPDGAVAGADCDVNGQIDSCEIASSYVTDFDGNAVPDVCDPIREDRDEVSPGTSVNFELDAGVANAGSIYWVFGSATGTSPGSPIPGGLELPLTTDAYTFMTLTMPLFPVFTTFIGFLDSEGKGVAALNIPPDLEPDLIGVTLFHAFTTTADVVVFDFVSNAVPVTTVP